MVRFATRFRRAGIAVSLHSAIPQTRARLLPLARRWSLGELRAAIAECAALQAQNLVIEYLLLDGVNDTDSELCGLLEWLHGMPVRIMLIPFNPFPAAESAGLRPTPEARQTEISQRLQQAGFCVTVRYSLGGDIAAACGQLAGLHPG
jgi:23S rRNA (adenine2503-C2)-methyltransferase